MATTNWCRGAVRPCRPPSQCTLPPKAASSTAATAGAAAPEGERGEAAREAEEGCTRISARSWTIKPGYANFSRCSSFKINALLTDLTDVTRFFPSLCFQTHQGREFTEEAVSAVSDERSSGTLSSAYPDVLMGYAQGTVRKAGALAVKNFLVHKKNKKVEPATKRKWKHYWVSLKGVVKTLVLSCLNVFF